MEALCAKRACGGPGIAPPTSRCPPTSRASLTATNSDIQFCVGEDREKINAHKIILAARCEVFRAMFAEHKAKPKASGAPTLLVLPEVRPTVFLTVLEFIYSNACKRVTAVLFPTRK